MNAFTAVDKFDKSSYLIDVRVLITPEAKGQFSALPVTIQQRVREITQRLLDWPDVSGAKPLHGQLKGYFRIRTGDWRVIFRPVGDEIWITRIANRRDVYED